jgi:L-arabinokinase
VQRFSEGYASKLPEVITGAEFVARFSKTADPLASINPEAHYLVRAATAHPVFEHQRVRRFRDLAREGRKEAAIEMGALMAESHKSYSACGLGSEGTDRLVDLIGERGPREGLFGAKISGGGSGGTVVVLTSQSAAPFLEQICGQYRAESGRGAQVFAGSSPGALNIDRKSASYRDGAWRLDPTS